MEEKKQKCHEDNRARLQEQGQNKQKISNEEKDVEREYIRNWYRNMLKEDFKKN